MEIKVEQQDDGLWLAEMLGESGLLAWGDTRQDALDNLRFLDARLSAHPQRTRQSAFDFARDDLPNQIHMTLCALVPLGVFFAALLVFQLSLPTASALCLISGTVSMFALAPLTALIYFGIAKIRYGEIPRNARVHTTDAGCSSLVFVMLLLISYSVVERIKQQAEVRREQSNTVPQQTK